VLPLRTAASLGGDSRDPEVSHVESDLNTVRRPFRRLSRTGVPRNCYEASGAVYVLQRALDRDG